jgi:histidyl-tRNA synthetase
MPDHHSDGDKNNLSFKLFEVEQIIKEIFISYKLDEIRTPALEDANLFNRSVGNTSDIVNKEIYIFNDRNDKAIALRPEGTGKCNKVYYRKKIRSNIA